MARIGDEDVCVHCERIITYRISTTVPEGAAWYHFNGIHPKSGRERFMRYCPTGSIPATFAVPLPEEGQVSI